MIIPLLLITTNIFISPVDVIVPFVVILPVDDMLHGEVRTPTPV